MDEEDVTWKIMDGRQANEHYDLTYMVRIIITYSGHFLPVGICNKLFPARMITVSHVF